LPPADNENVELLLAEVKLEKKKKKILREPIEESAAEKKRVLQTASELGIRDKKRLHEQLIKRIMNLHFLMEYQNNHSREPF
jgi:hypothetical protein